MQNTNYWNRMASTSEHQRKWYQANRRKALERRHEYYKNNQQEIKERNRLYHLPFLDRINVIKLARGCDHILTHGPRCGERCGYNHCASVLCWHHKDPSSKLFCIANGNRCGRTWTDIEKEIEKCELLCSNCHGEVEDETLQKNGRRRPQRRNGTQPELNNPQLLLDFGQGQ